jgi:hypothetical protein
MTLSDSFPRTVRIGFEEEILATGEGEETLTLWEFVPLCYGNHGPENKDTY